MSQKKAAHKWKVIFNSAEMRPRKTDLDQNLSLGLLESLMIVINE